MKYFYYILLGLLPFFCTSCWWSRIPDGRVEGPIVIDPVESAGKIINGEMAANRMTTSLVMKCPAIVSSGKEKPKVINDFVISSNKVNYLQMEVWRSLVNMNMIKPVSDKKENPIFELESEIRKLPEMLDGKIMYSWIMSMKRIADNKEIWREKIEFGE